MALLFRHYHFNPFLTLLVCLFAYLIFKLGFEDMCFIGIYYILCYLMKLLTHL